MASGIPKQWQGIHDYYAEGDGDMSKDWSVNVAHETGTQNMADASGTSSLYYTQGEQKGREPATNYIEDYQTKNWKGQVTGGGGHHNPIQNPDGSWKIDDVDIQSGAMNANFQDASGTYMGYGGNFEMHKDVGSNAYGDFSSGQFQFTRNSDSGDWMMEGPYGSNPVSNEFVDQTYANQMRKAQNMSNVVMNPQQGVGVQQVWEAANPLAAGDTMGLQNPNIDSGAGTQANPYVSDPVYASSTNEYLESRQDINNPDNIPTGQGGSGDGFFSFLKDFKMNKGT